MQDHLHVGGQLAQLHGQVRHVHGAGGRVDHRDRDQEHHRGEHGDHHVGDARADALGGAPHGQQHVGGRQEDLEAHVEVEQVAGEERVGHARHEDQERGVEDRDRPTLVPVDQPLRRGVQQHRQGDQRRHHEHEGREPIHHEADAQRGRPAAEVDGRDPGVPDRGQQQRVQHEGEHERGDRDGDLRAGAAHEHEGHGRAQHGQHDGQRGQVGQGDGTDAHARSPPSGRRPRDAAPDPVGAWGAGVACCTWGRASVACS